MKKHCFLSILLLLPKELPDLCLLKVEDFYQGRRGEQTKCASTSQKLGKLLLLSQKKKFYRKRERETFFLQIRKERCRLLITQSTVDTGY